MIFVVVVEVSSSYAIFVENLENSLMLAVALTILG
jgi:hypothetical protein